MNFLCVSRDVLSKYGFLSSKFRHGAADYYYGLHLFQNKLKLCVAENPVGICKRDHDHMLVNLAASSIMAQGAYPDVSIAV